MSAAVPAPPMGSARSGVIDYVSPLPADREEPEDRALIERLKSRDENALKEIYERHSRPVFSFLVRFTGDRPAAEDVQQQVFLELWQKVDRFDPDRGSLRNWLMMIARSRAIDNSRRRVPEPHDPQGGAGLLDGGGDGKDEIKEAMDAWQFSQIIGQLPHDEAELLRYRFQDGLSQSEIAGRTGIPLGTVKSRMVSGIERLRKMMEKDS